MRRATHRAVVGADKGIVGLLGGQIDGAVVGGGRWLRGHRRRRWRRHFTAAAAASGRGVVVVIDREVYRCGRAAAAAAAAAAGTSLRNRHDARALGRRAGTGGYACWWRHRRTR